MPLNFWCVISVGLDLTLRCRVSCAWRKPSESSLVTKCPRRMYLWTLYHRLWRRCGFSKPRELFTCPRRFFSINFSDSHIFLHPFHSSRPESVSFCMIYDIISYRIIWCIYIFIFNLNWVDTRWQQYITHLHTNSTHNTGKAKLGSAGRAPSLRVIHWHLPYNWGKSTEKPQLG
jgi:hypothetical protein